MRKAVRAKEIIESAMPVAVPSGTLDNIDELAPSNDETFDIGPVSNPEDTPEKPKMLDEDKLANIRVFKCKPTAYKKSFPGKSSDLNWSALNGNNIEEIEELYNKVMLTLNHGYQKSASMVGVAYQTAMSGLEGAAKMTGGLVGWRQDNGNRSNQESKFDFLATLHCLVKIDKGQQKIKIIHPN